MIKGDIYLENTIRCTIKSKHIFKIVLLIEYLSIFIESMNTVRYLHNEVESTTSYNALDIINKINPFYYFKALVNCQNSSVVITTCSIPSNMIFYICFCVYFALFFIYKIKYEQTSKECSKNVQKDNNEIVEYNNKISIIQRILINYFNIGLRILSIGLYYLNISTFISAFTLLLNLGFDWMQFLLIIMSFTIFIFSFVLEFNLIKYSTLMFRYNDVNSHFDCLFSLRYDYFLLIIKILISLRSTLIYFNANIIEIYSRTSSNLTTIYFDCLLIFHLLILAIFIMFILSDLNNRKILFISCFTINFYRLFFLLYNLIFVLFFYFLYQSNKSIVIMSTSLISLLIISFFLAQLLFAKNTINLMTDDNLIFMAVYMYQKENKGDRENQIKMEFTLRHKLKCPYRDMVFHRHSDFVKGFKFNKEDEAQMCHLCISDDSNGIQLDALMLQIKKNHYQSRNAKLTKVTREEKHYYKILKLILKNNEDDIIGLVYETNKVLQRSQGTHHSFVKLYYDLISFKTENQQALKRFTDINKIHKVTKIIERVLKELIEVYNGVKGSDCDIHSLAERVSADKKTISESITDLLKKSNNTDNYTIIILKFIFENLFNDDSLFTGENNFYDFDDYLTTVFTENKTMQIFYNYTRNSLQIIKASHLFNEFHNYNFEELFPTQIKHEQKDNFTKIIKKTLSNNFEVECLINSLPNKLYIAKMKLSCVISYSLEMSEFFIQAKYQLLDEDLLMGIMERDQIYILSCSENLGLFLHLPSNIIKLFNQFGVKINFGYVFKKTISDEVFMFNYNEYLNYFRSLYNDVIKQIQSDELTNIFNSLNDAVNNSKQSDYLFKLLRKGTFSNYQIFSVIQNEIVKNNKTPIDNNTLNIINLVENKFANEESLVNSIGSTESYYNKRESVYSRNKTSLKNMDKATLQEHLNTSKLNFLSKLLSTFSVIVILYCIIFMISGVKDNVNMNESFLIKNKYDYVERIIYHTTTGILNNIVLIEKNSMVTSNVENASARYFKNLNANPNITINILDFIKDETNVKIDLFQTSILDLENLISSSSYRSTYNSYMAVNINYSFLSNIAGSIGINSLSYSFYDSLKIYMNNIKLINNNNSTWVYLYIFSIKNGYNGKNDDVDFSNIYNTQLSKTQVYTYELLINYIKIFSPLFNIRFLILNNHLQTLKDIFSRCFYLTYILLGIHFLLILLSVLLISHLKNIMIFNRTMINELITNEIKMKQMKRKLNILTKMNMFFSEDPNSLAKKLSKITKEVILARKQLEDGKNKKKKDDKNQIDESEYHYTHEKSFYPLDLMRHVTPLIKLIFGILFIYFFYSLIFLTLLKISSNDILTTTDYFTLSTIRFKNLINSLNLIHVQILTNSTDQETYDRFVGTETANNGLITTIQTSAFNKWEQLENYNSKTNLFSSIPAFLKNQLTCEFLYYNSNDPLYEILIQQYSVENSNVDVTKSLSSICESIDLNTSADTNLIEERLIYSNKQLLQAFQEAYPDYDKMKAVYDMPKDKLYIMTVFILRPINTYVSGNLINSIEIALFNIFLRYSIIQLSLNIIVDILIVVIFQFKIIRQIRHINDDLTSLLEIVKIY